MERPEGVCFHYPLSDSERIFVHIKVFKNRSNRPQLNQEVIYSLSQDKQGWLCATDVHAAGEMPNAARKVGNSGLSLLIGGLFLAAVGGAEYIANHSFLMIGVYFLASLLASVFYSIDKCAIRQGAWRTPEAHLHLLSLVGGWPGAMLAQQTSRHKSRKREFRVVFWITVAVNCTISISLLTPNGIRMLDSTFNALSDMI